MTHVELFAFKNIRDHLQSLSKMTSFIEYAPETDFPIQNIPFGVFSTAEDVRTTLSLLLLCPQFC